MSDSKDDAFLEECRSVARCFLYFSIEEDLNTRSPDAATKKTDDLKRFPLNEESQAVEVGRRLRELGDRINEQIKVEMEEKLKEILQTRSVWEIGRSEFSGLCEGVMTRCHSLFNTNWDRMWVVYTLMGRVVVEVRQQEGTYQSASESSTSSRDVMPTDGDSSSASQTPSLRERNLQDFACDFLRDSGLQEWIESQGGMVSGLHIISFTRL